jgi:hypothetical protein
MWAESLLGWERRVATLEAEQQQSARLIRVQVCCNNAAHAVQHDEHLIRSIACPKGHATYIPPRRMTTCNTDTTAAVAYDTTHGDPVNGKARLYQRTTVRAHAAQESKVHELAEERDALRLRVAELESHVCRRVRRRCELPVESAVTDRIGRYRIGSAVNYGYAVTGSTGLHAGHGVAAEHARAPSRRLAAGASRAHGGAARTAQRRGQ